MSCWVLLVLIILCYLLFVNMISYHVLSMSYYFVVFLDYL